MKVRKVIELVRSDLHPMEKHRKFKDVELEHFEGLDEDTLDYIDYIIFTDVGGNNIKLLKCRNGRTGTLKVE